MLGSGSAAVGWAERLLMGSKRHRKRVENPDPPSPTRRRAGWREGQKTPGGQSDWQQPRYASVNGAGSTMHHSRAEGLGMPPGAGHKPFCFSSIAHNSPVLLY
ncbi:hypothetical protein GGTG_02623 [Gaeumannomyces tritici R3-111a-1]|uniref:Uncharacterized protein n=1 Tax=Gaeumannomyces tritici (strain R3-111a-1) TaxID=644352 RepID=J3NMW5_GAET3|nr:hypothetical protein GGTG_02623 [Gaeumannomyces tritici R3-111a-1]EJT77516.1 hypothetical protein GGTG_02623 [Gaeumannomyces tritici R3-111a-1]